MTDTEEVIDELCTACFNLANAADKADYITAKGRYDEMRSYVLRRLTPQRTNQVTISVELAENIEALCRIASWIHAANEIRDAIAVVEGK